ncbi:hypothetical protein [Brucella intermedia]|uniref:hypothetical protein n=1 Tax=Brucella intermedia TaxID=94625 RepID=UPI002447679A|nr:hypothetical protein [Brucella intermedia]WGG61911.1 hypothetical protein QA414_15440 [Brucella intermedia]
MAKFKVGDRVQVVDDRVGRKLGETGEIIGIDITLSTTFYYIKWDAGVHEQGLYENRLEALPVAEAAGKPAFKVGDRVQLKHAKMTGTIKKIPGDALRDEPSYAVNWDWYPDGDLTATTYESEIELASLTIETGKYYRTRDGRKVGPMEIWNPAVEHPWRQQGGSAVFSAGGDIWRDDGSSEYDVPQLIAEWVDEPSSNDNQPVAEQQAGTVFIDVSKAGPSQLHLAKGRLVKVNQGFGFELARYGDYVWVDTGKKQPVVAHVNEIKEAA